MRNHVPVLAWLQIALGILDLFVALAVFAAVTGAGVLFGLLGGAGASVLGGALGLALGSLVALTALPNLLAGFGLLAWKGWARILALVLAVLNVFKFPWGTALAAYTFWVLTDEEARRAFRS